MAISTILTTLATNLTTETGHQWAVNTPFGKDVKGTRQGRIYVNWHSIPARLEASQVEWWIEFHTRLLAQNESQRIGNLDYSELLNAHILTAAYNLVDIVPTNGDRHGATVNNVNQALDSAIVDVNVVTTAHFYTLMSEVDPIRIPLN